MPLLTYLFTYRACIANKKDAGKTAEENDEKMAPRKGKFNTIRGGSSQTRAGVDSFEPGPEHADLTCPTCKSSLAEGGLLVRADGIVYHSDCCFCQHDSCNKKFEDFFWPFQGRNYCFDHYLEAAALVCSACDEQIREDAVLVHGQKYHSKCWVCLDCNAGERRTGDQLLLSSIQF